MKIRFTLNQAGLALEYFAHGDWRMAVLIRPSQIELNGGISLIKSKILLGIVDRYELTPAGEYREDGRTIICV